MQPNGAKVSKKKRDTSAARHASLAARSSKSSAPLFPSDDEGGAGDDNGNGEDDAVQRVSSQTKDTTREAHEGSPADVGDVDGSGISGFRLVDMTLLMEFITDNMNCKRCRASITFDKEARQGLASSLSFNCGCAKDLLQLETSRDIEGRKIKEVNMRMVSAVFQTGGAFARARRLVGHGDGGCDRTC